MGQLGGGSVGWGWTPGQCRRESGPTSKTSDQIRGDTATISTRFSGGVDFRSGGHSSLHLELLFPLYQWHKSGGIVNPYMIYILYVREGRVCASPTHRSLSNDQPCLDRFKRDRSKRGELGFNWVRRTASGDFRSTNCTLSCEFFFIWCGQLFGIDSPDTNSNPLRIIYLTPEALKNIYIIKSRVFF